MFEKIKNLFKKQEVFSCIVWDGKIIRYLDLTQKYSTILVLITRPFPPQAEQLE
jgi:hypothetical protein